MCERQLFPRTRRLTARHEYDQVFARGEKIWGRFYVCHVWIDSTKGSRLGLVVSRKVGNAVVRNRVKRHIREFFRLHHVLLQPGMQLVVVARPDSADHTGRACAAELLTQLNRFSGHV
ncbi:MAG: ribonuclease P protein component [Candidatus Hydrogenedens sp.]|nr:ribonuclease P protein component [Candidatus Hydrogenedens sp.]